MVRKKPIFLSTPGLQGLKVALLLRWLLPKYKTAKSLLLFFFSFFFIHFQKRTDFPLFLWILLAFANANATYHKKLE